MTLAEDDPDVVAHIAKELDAALEQRSFILVLI